jgi:hypothetical protein
MVQRETSSAGSSETERQATRRLPSKDKFVNKGLSVSLSEPLHSVMKAYPTKDQPDGRFLTHLGVGMVPSTVLSSGDWRNSGEV